MDKVARLKELKEMLDQGLVSQAEYDRLRAEILTTGPLGFRAGPLVMPHQPLLDWITFRDPVSGHMAVIKRSSTFWLTFLFGCFYLGYKGAWMWAGIALVAALFTYGLSWFVFPFFAYRIIVDSYRRAGWTELQPGSASILAAQGR
jgi:hypothetical protein